MECGGCNGSGVCSFTDPEEHMVCEECGGSGSSPGEDMTSLALYVKKHGALPPDDGSFVNFSDEEESSEEN